MVHDLATLRTLVLERLELDLDTELRSAAHCDKAEISTEYRMRASRVLSGELAHVEAEARELGVLPGRTVYVLPLGHFAIRPDSALDADVLAAALPHESREQCADRVARELGGALGVDDFALELVGSVPDRDTDDEQADTGDEPLDYGPEDFGGSDY